MAKKRKQKKKEPKEYDDNVLEIRRVTRVMAGGKRMSFRSTVAVGNRKGKVGVGIGKGTDIADSIRKGKTAAKKNMISVPLHENRTIPYDVDVKYGAAKIRMKPVPEGHGLIAGGAARVILDLAGVQDITTKLLGNTGNKINNAKVTIKALEQFNHLLKNNKKEKDKEKKEDKEK